MSREWARLESGQNMLNHRPENCVKSSGTRKVTIWNNLEPLFAQLTLSINPPSHFLLQEQYTMPHNIKARVHVCS
jgi:hypothetical protein